MIFPPVSNIKLFLAGDYDVNILFDGQHIPGSPFKVMASEPVDVSKVKVTGPGVGKTVPASIPVEFTVDATKTGKAPCTVEVIGPKDEVYPCEVKDNGDKTFTCKYTPKRKGKYYALKYRSPINFGTGVDKN